MKTYFFHEKYTYKTYISAIHHCEDALSAAAWNSDTPISVIVGVIASGPINRSTIPISPVKPMITWTNDATMIAPCTYIIKAIDDLT